VPTCISQRRKCFANFGVGDYFYFNIGFATKLFQNPNEKLNIKCNENSL
jgi:hypothetical protein